MTSATEDSVPTFAADGSEETSRQLRGSTLLMDPCIPPAWRRYEIVFRYRSSRYEIVVENPRGVSRGVTRVERDDVECPHGVPLEDDGATHRVRVRLG